MLYWFSPRPYRAFGEYTSKPWYFIMIDRDKRLQHVGTWHKLCKVISNPVVDYQYFESSAPVLHTLFTSSPLFVDTQITRQMKCKKRKGLGIDRTLKLEKHFQEQQCCYCIVSCGSCMSGNPLQCLSTLPKVNSIESHSIIIVVNGAWVEQSLEGCIFENMPNWFCCIYCNCLKWDWMLWTLVACVH